jgi:hypothetical protein
MSTKFTRGEKMNRDNDKLERVFSDADVIDLDFSCWDKRVSIWVLADHWEDWHHRKPLVIVDFNNASEFKLDFPDKGNGPDAQSQHVHWHIYSIEIAKKSAFDVSLRGSASSPELRICCEAVSFRTFSIEKVDILNPGWDEPYRGLARPSISKLAESMQM